MGILNQNQLNDTALVVGNKVLGLGWLNQHGFAVPRFFALDYISLRTNHKNPDHLKTDLDNWIRENNISSDALWSVRSSATVEDGQSQSFAGRFKTKTDVSAQNLADAVLEVLEAYTQVEGTFEYGVVIQEMIAADFSGVLFTHDPLDTTYDQGLLNVIPGKGENLVSGEISALSIYLDSRKPQHLDDVYNGVKGHDIYSHLQGLFSEFRSATKNILRLKNGQPQDLEFCVRSGQIFWLQIRPMTALEKKRIIRIWDNTQAEGNFSGMTSPLSISFVKQTLGVAYWNMAVYMGCSREVLEQGKPFFDQYCGSVYGRLYYNLNAWQYSLYQCPFGNKLVKQLLKTWGTDEAELEKPTVRNSAWRRFRMLFRFVGLFLKFRKMQRNYEQNYHRLMDEFRQKDLTNKSHQELIDIEKGAEKHFGELWLTPSLNGFFVIILFYLLNRKIRKSGIAGKYPNFFNDVLYAQDEVISVQLVNDFRRIVLKVQEDAELKKLFETAVASEVLSRLKEQHPDFLKTIQDYITRYGVRTTEGEMKIETINYRENPELFIEFIQSNMTGSFSSRAEKLDWQKVVDERYSINILNRWYFKYLIRKTINAVKNRENYRFYRAEVYDVIRRILRAIDKELLVSGKIDQAGDSLYLQLDEVCNPLRSDEFRTLIQVRKENYGEWKSIEMTKRFHELDSGIFEPVFAPVLSQGSGLIKGVGCSSGICRAKVKIIRSREDIMQDVSGYILIGGNFEPGWINLFAKATGIISERGNLLSHTAILCRELGIPSIVGAKNILSLVSENDELFMNGATGEIQIISENEL